MTYTKHVSTIEWFGCCYSSSRPTVTVLCQQFNAKDQGLNFNLGIFWAKIMQIL